jgi:ubiquinone/menaquinone biosynthesis C-methylase UbiE
VTTDLQTFVARTFDDAAPEYDTVGPEFFGRFGRRLVELTELDAGAFVLELGSGTGAATLPAAEAVGASGRVVGVDLSPGMVARARAMVAEHGLDHVELIVGDATTVPADPGTVDTVIAAHLLFFLEDLDAALDGCLRALRPGGTLAASSWADAKDTDEDAWNAVYGSFFAHVPDGAVPNITPSGDTFKSDATLSAALEARGFADVRHVTETYEVVFDDSEQWIDWMQTHGARAFWDAIPTGRRAQARADAIAALAPLANPDGSLNEPTAVRYTFATRPAEA